MSAPNPAFSDSDSDDSSSSSSSGNGPRELAPSSHSGLSDEEDRAPIPAPSQSASAAAKPQSPLSSSESSSSESDNEEAAPAPAPEASKPAPSPARSATPASPAARRSRSSTPSSQGIGGSPVHDAMNDLSLSDDDDAAPKSKPSRRSATPIDSDDDIAGPRLHQDPNDVPVTQPPIYYDIPLEKGDYGKEGPVLVRWPNFISVDSRPFTEDTYDCEGEDVTAVNDDGRSKLQLKVENCIRWRKKLDADGNVIEDPVTSKLEVESNAKIVRWSDGSMTLQLGSETYEVNEQKIEEYNHLFLRMRSGLHGNAVFRKRYNFRPYSTDSMTHRKMTMTMAEKTNKSQRVKILADVGHDPEAGRMTLIRKEDERMRAVARREAQQRKQKERQYRSGLSQGFLEDRDDYDDDPESLSSIKKSYQSGSHRNNRFDRLDAIARRYMSDEEDDDDDSRRIEQAKIESDDDEPSSSTKKRDEKKKRRIVIEDEDED